MDKKTGNKWDMHRYLSSNDTVTLVRRYPLLSYRSETVNPRELNRGPVQCANLAGDAPCTLIVAATSQLASMEGLEPGRILNIPLRSFVFLSVPPPPSESAIHLNAEFRTERWAFIPVRGFPPPTTNKRAGLMISMVRRRVRASSTSQERHTDLAEA